MQQRTHLKLHDEELDNKLGRSETAAAAVLDGAGNNIAEQFATVNATLSNGIQSKAVLKAIDANVEEYIKVSMRNQPSQFLLVVQTSIGINYAAYLVRNYGSGGTDRCKITQLSGAAYSKFIDSTDLYIRVLSSSRITWYANLHLLQGAMPTIEFSDTYAGTAITNTLPAELESRLAALESAIATTAE